MGPRTPPKRQLHRLHSDLAITSHNYIINFSRVISARSDFASLLAAIPLRLHIFSDCCCCYILRMPGQHKICVHVGFHGIREHRCNECRCKCPSCCRELNAASATGREPAGSAILKSTAPVDPGSSSSKVPRTIFVCDSACAQALADVGAAPYNRGASYSGDDAKDGCAAEARRVCQKRNRGVPMHAGEPRSSSPPG